MKIKITIAILLCSIGVFGQQKPKPTIYNTDGILKKVIHKPLISSNTVTVSAQSKQYHMIVECYSAPFEGNQYYHIKFTANNWQSSDEIHKCVDITNYATNDISDHREYKDVDFMPVLSTNKHELILLAKRFKTLELAKKYNDSVLNRYRTRHTYFMKIKPKFKPIHHAPLKKQCCTVTNVY